MAHEDLGLGQLITEPRGRDAIHVAVAPVKAAEDLPPGAHVGLCRGTTDEVYETDEGAVGVIDPFLHQLVRKGERCWLFLYPNTVTGLRHVWSHPAFKTAPPRKEATHDER
jgi:hypothetical protein